MAAIPMACKLQHKSLFAHFRDDNLILDERFYWKGNDSPSLPLSSPEIIT
jgi:hypothetical protein